MNFCCSHELACHHHCPVPNLYISIESCYKSWTYLQLAIHRSVMHYLSTDQATGGIESAIASLDSKNGLAHEDSPFHALHENDPGTAHISSPIDNLSVDIMCAIFNLDADYSRPNSYQPYDYIDSMPARVRSSWMRLSHVCRFWRMIVLGMSTLWGRDILAFGIKGEAFDAILTRAQNAPFHLSFGRVKIDQNNLALILTLIPRAKVLKINRESGDGQAVLDFISTRSLPFLQSFIISGSLYESRHKKVTYLVKATSTRYLVMARVYLQPPVHGNLVELRILLSERSLRPPMNDLLHILSQNPALRILSLKDAFREHSTAEPLPRLILPALTDFFIYFNESTGTSAHCYKFISLLDMPKVWNYDLQVCLRKPASYNSVQASELLQAALFACSGSPACSPSPSALQILRKSEWLYVTLCSYDNGSLEMKRRFSLGVRTDRPQSPDMDVVIGHFLNAGVLGHVQMLHVGTKHIEARAAERWDANLSPFVQVEELCLDVIIENAVAILAPLARAREPHPLMPRLRKVVVSHKRTDDELEKMRKLANTRSIVLKICGGFEWSEYKYGKWDERVEDLTGGIYNT